MTNYDVIIVGSGLGGLECAAILSKEGYKVCVLEKNELFGGCFQSFKRKGHLLDTGIHYVGSLDEGQILNQYFKYFGILDKLKLRRLDADGFDVLNFADKTYNFAIGHDNFYETLVKDFPEDSKGLKQFVELIKKIGENINIDQLKKGRFSGDEGINYLSVSTIKEVEKSVSNKILQNLLSSYARLYGGEIDNASFYTHALVLNSYIESSYRFVDGSMQVTNELIKRIIENGGVVRNNSEVTRMVIENGVLSAVEINEDERLYAKSFISNMHPVRTLQLLDSNTIIKQSYVDRLKNSKNSSGIFTVYLLTKKDTVLYQNKNLIFHATGNVWEMSKSVDGCFICMQAESHSSKYANVVSIHVTMDIEELSPWVDTVRGKRGRGYKDFKAQKANEIIEFATSKFPALKGNIEKVYTASPLSYREYTATVDGSAYGIITSFKSPLTTLISPRTKISNLFLTGQNLNAPGALGVTVSAMMTCSFFVGMEYLAKKVGNV